MNGDIVKIEAKNSEDQDIIELTIRVYRPYLPDRPWQPKYMDEEETKKYSERCKAYDAVIEKRNKQLEEMNAFHIGRVEITQTK